MKNKKFGELLIDSIPADLSPLTAVGDAVIEKLMEGVVPWNIPILGIVSSFYRIGLNVRDALFICKLEEFLFRLKDIPRERRQEFVNRISEDEQFRQRIGKNLILILDKLDDEKKPSMLGNVFKAYIEGYINYDAFHRLCSAVDKINLQDVPGLIAYYNNDPESPPDYVLQNLAVCGLVSIEPSKAYVAGGGGGYIPNELGRLFIRYALTEPIDI